MKWQLLIPTLLAILLGVGGTALAVEAKDDHGAAHAGEATTVAATGTVKSVDLTKGKLVIDHEPIPALHWPRMVMDFQLADPAMAKEVKVGDKVQFEMEEGKKGSYMIIMIKPVQK